MMNAAMSPHGIHDSPLISGEDLSAALPCHDAHHLLQPFVAWWVSQK